MKKDIVFSLSNICYQSYPVQWNLDTLQEQMILFQNSQISEINSNES
jgi:hypothetical protein